MPTATAGGCDVEAFVDDLRRVGTLREWGVDPDDVRARLRPGMSTGEAIAAVYETYAAARGKPRWGDKTPMYMQHLPLLERLFPAALFLHLVRDGRDAATSYLQMPSGIVTESWGHPASVRDFGCQWATEVQAGRALGRRVGARRYFELRYEDLVASPEDVLGQICAFAGLPWEPGMLGYAEEVDVSARPHQQNLRRPPTVGLRNWRTDLEPGDVAGFEDVAGDVLAALGYELAGTAQRLRPEHARSGEAPRLPGADMGLADDGERRSALSPLGAPPPAAGLGVTPGGSACPCRRRGTR